MAQNKRKGRISRRELIKKTVKRREGKNQDIRKQRQDKNRKERICRTEPIKRMTRRRK